MKTIRNLIVLLFLGLVMLGCTSDGLEEYNQPVQPVQTQKCEYRVIKYSTWTTPNIVLFDSVKMLPMDRVPFMYGDSDGVIMAFKPLQYGESDYYNSDYDNIGVPFGYLRVEVFRDANY